MQGRAYAVEKGSGKVNGSNPTFSLLDLCDGDVPESQAEHAKETGQRAHVAAIMADGRWHTLPGLVKELRQRFGVLYAETSISARLRELRKRGWEVTHMRTRPGSNLYQYKAEKLLGQAKAANAESEAAA